MVVTQPVPPRVIVVSPRPKPRIARERHIRTIVNLSGSAIDDELSQARMAWKEYQSTRKRDAIYDYEQRKVIDVAQFTPQSFQDVPIPVACGGSVCVCEVLLEMALHQIVIQKCIVDVEQEYDSGRFGHCSPLLF
jgi:hypothetical protein